MTGPDVPLQLKLAILAAFPTAATMVDRNRNLPLHIALNCSSRDITPSELTLAIIAAHPGAHVVPHGSLGNSLPFEIAVQSAHPTSVLAALLELEPAGIDGAVTGTGVTFRNVLLSSGDETCRHFGATWGCELGVFKLEGGPLIHKSRSALARYAIAMGGARAC